MKCQSNLVIAGSQRNVFKYSVFIGFIQGIDITRYMASPEEHLLVNLRRWRNNKGSETIGANVNSQEGNNPDIKLRSKIKNSV